MKKRLHTSGTIQKKYGLFSQSMKVKMECLITSKRDKSCWNFEKNENSRSKWRRKKDRHSQQN
jgi:hypothetical protein